MRYVPPDLLEAWARRDPIDRQQRRLAELGVDVEAVRGEVKQVVDRATEEALAMPMPDPATAAEGVFAQEAVPLGDGQAPWSGFRRAGGDASGGSASDGAPRRRAA
jgi:TPP-dependent pyruvate/acetoin dehydrogenase alpha subunit